MAEVSLPEELLDEDGIDDVFEAAAAYVAIASSSLPSDALLRLYGLYKQATGGPCSTSAPSFFDRKGRAKW